MKYIIFLAALCLSLSVNAQTVPVIPATTTIEAFSAMAPGTYRFFGTGIVKDTTDLSNVVCPVCTICPVCPVCPVCPPVPRARNATGFMITKIGTVIVTYDIGPTSTFIYKNAIIIQ